MVAAALVVPVSCDEPEPVTQPRTEASVRPERTKASAKTRSLQRKRTLPKGVGIDNRALTAADERRVRRAIADLRRLRFWKDLTAEVKSVRISTRPGPERIPGDGHLADAIRNVELGRRPGFVCDVMLFSQAIADDVARQGSFYSQGRLTGPPPTLRQFWAVILAHELAHCTDRGQRGEAYSTKWEGAVLHSFGAARLGSPAG